MSKQLEKKNHKSKEKNDVKENLEKNLAHKKNRLTPLQQELKKNKSGPPVPDRGCYNDIIQPYCQTPPGG